MHTDSVHHPSSSGPLATAGGHLLRRANGAVRRRVGFALAIALCSACEGGAVDLVREMEAARGDCDASALQSSDESCVQMMERYAEMGTDLARTYIGGLQALDRALERMPAPYFDAGELGRAVDPALLPGADPAHTGGLRALPPLAAQGNAARSRLSPDFHTGGFNGSPLPSSDPSRVERDGPAGLGSVPLRDRQYHGFGFGAPLGMGWYSAGPDLWPAPGLDGRGAYGPHAPGTAFRAPYGYGAGYDYEPGYGYEPGHGYGPGYGSGYGYEPGYGYGPSYGSGYAFGGWYGSGFGLPYSSFGSPYPPGYGRGGDYGAGRYDRRYGDLPGSVRGYGYGYGGYGNYADPYGYGYAYPPAPRSYDRDPRAGSGYPPTSAPWRYDSYRYGADGIQPGGYGSGHPYGTPGYDGYGPTPGYPQVGYGYRDGYADTGVQAPWEDWGYAPPGSRPEEDAAPPAGAGVAGPPVHAPGVLLPPSERLRRPWLND